MNEADDGTGSGATGAGGTAEGTGGTPSLTTGTNVPTGGGTPTGNGNDRETPETIGKGTFFEGLEEQLYTDPSLKPFLNAEGGIDGKNLIKSYVHAKRQLGRNKITIPGENATDDEWSEVFRSLGMPEADKYTLNEKNPNVLTPEFYNEFKTKAMEAGMLPRQAQAMLDWYSDSVQEATTQEQEMSNQKYNESLTALKNEWGQAYDRNLQIAKKAFSTFADESTMEQIDAEGLGNNLTLIKLFHSIGAKMTEDVFKGESLPSGVLTPEEAKREINDAMTDPNGPYLNPAHPNHAVEVKRIHKLFEIAG